MKSALPWLVAVSLSLVAGVTFLSLRADDKDKAPETDAAPKDPDLVFTANFDDQKPGPIPSTYFVVDGDWTVAEIDGGIAMKLSETPLIDAQVQVGDSLKETGGTIRARVKADKKRRSFPRFGIGLHGMTGYRLRLFPVQNKVELVRNEEVVQSADLEWHPNEWWFMELTVKPAGDAWTVSGRSWPESGKRPEQAQIEYISTESKFSGKASVNGTPFAGLPIFFDDIEVRKIDHPAAPPVAGETKQ